ncbi:MAG: UDP-N-acetylmuramoyl-L-alanyl-D-glutamate--2,6-diaminopimelate ligase [Calditerrivibrio sp.]|nr:UDP-N-acetylmuramoyl-L-alanyl-D-glutamate--2,6-diaminopimelate ligase [Calditerrivibrio sp.]
MLAKYLLNGVEYCSISDTKLLELEVMDISFNTNDIKEQSVFVLIKGSSFDPYKVVDDLYRSGKVLFFISEIPLQGIPCVVVSNCRSAFGIICRNLFDIDFRKVKLFGVTGTNGKTTTNYLIDNILRKAGYKTVRIGTTDYCIVDEKYEAVNTTPGIYDIFSMIRQGLTKGGNAVCMEVSSHALDQGRVFGLNFDVSVFTNLSGDHLDYHKTMEDYYQAKRKLFTKQYSKSCCINIDHEYGKRLYEEVDIEKHSYSTLKADVYAKNVNYSLEGTRCVVVLGDRAIEVDSPLVGRHNLENILAAVTATYVTQIPIDVIKEGINQFKNVPGRLEKFSKDGVYFFVDYAHTDDALRNVLTALRPFKKNRLITVFGCGGDRDRTKRPRMAKVAEEFSDLVVVTSDNPRTEDPKGIISEILAGFNRKGDVIVEEDRRKAISLVCKQAKEGDIVLIAGKGHENYQIIGKTKYHFDDREEVAKNLGVEFEAH